MYDGNRQSLIHAKLRKLAKSSLSVQTLAVCAETRDHTFLLEDCSLRLPYTDLLRQPTPLPAVRNKPPGYAVGAIPQNEHGPPDLSISVHLSVHLSFLQNPVNSVRFPGPSCFGCSDPSFMLSCIFCIQSTSYDLKMVALYPGIAQASQTRMAENRKADPFFPNSSIQ